MYTTVQVRSEFGNFAYTAICMRNVYTLIIHAFLLVFIAQLIWSSVTTNVPMQSFSVRIPLWQGVLDTILYDNVCQWHVTHCIDL
jgi:hypothetical protein